jgi:hypothetical protein
MSMTLIALLNTLAERCKQGANGWIRGTEDMCKAHLGDLAKLAVISARHDPIDPQQSNEILTLSEALLRGKEGWNWKLVGLQVRGLDGMCPREALDIALLERGLEPGVLPPSHVDRWPDRPSIRWSMRMDWAVENRYLGLAQRLLWHPQAAAWYATHSVYKSSGNTSPAALREQADGWAWIIRNSGDEILSLLISHGAPTNHVDAMGRPALAYARNDTAISILLDAGADPLASTIDYSQRRIALRALWAGWQWEIVRGLVPAAVGYIQRSLMQWDPDERNQAVAEILLRLDNLLFSGGSNSCTFRGDLARMVGLGENEKPHYLDNNGKAWAWEDRQAWALMCGQDDPDEACATVEGSIDKCIIAGVDNSLWSTLALICQRREEDHEKIMRYFEQRDCDELGRMAGLAIEHCLTHTPKPHRRGIPTLSLLGSLMGGWQPAGNQWIAQALPLPQQRLAEYSLRAMVEAWITHPDETNDTLAPIAHWWSVSGRDRPLDERALAACLLLGRQLRNLPDRAHQVLGRWLDEATQQQWVVPHEFPGVAQALRALNESDPLRASHVQASQLDK